VGIKQTVETVLNWLRADEIWGNYRSAMQVWRGSLSIPAQAGAKVYASDISEKMVGEGRIKPRQSW